MLRLASLALALVSFAACSDDPVAQGDTRDAVADQQEVEIPVDDDTGPDVEPDTTPDVAPDTSTCEHPCLDEFGKNDKSLCPVPQSDWVCTEGCCVPVFECATDADCEAHGFEEEQCDDERFACVCNTGSQAAPAPDGVEVGGCFTWLCAVAADCGDGELCAGGACVAAPDPKGLALRILQRPTVLTPGAHYQLSAEAYDPEDAEIVVAVDPTWSSTDDEVVSVDADGNLSGGANAGGATITATNGDNVATIVVENVLPAGSDITLVVRTELSGEPVTGRYAVIDGAGATVLAEDLPLEGVVRIATTESTGPWTVHIMADENDWVTWAGLVAGDTRYLPIPKTVYGDIVMDMEGTILTGPDETKLRNVGVVTGTPDFTTYSYEGTLEIVLTTTGLSSALFDFNIAVLLGSDVKRFMDPDAQIPRVDPTDPIDIPGGIVFNLLGPAIPSYVLTMPKGHHRVWSLGGKLSINDVAEYSGVIFDAIGGGDLDFTKIVGAVFPLFKGFWSAYGADVEVTEVGIGSEPVAYTSRLTTPMGFNTMLDVPALPPITGEAAVLGTADGLFLLSGAETVDGFMVPLGLSGGADTSDKENNPPDGIADGNEKTPEKDPFALPAAPLHAGLQGPSTRYLVAAVAAAIPVGDDPRPSSGSATLARWGMGEHPPAAYTLQSFLGFPSLALTGTDFETRTIAVAEGEGTELLRVLLKGKRGAHWTFYGVAPGELHVPNPADFGVETDRFLRDDLESVLMNCLDFAAGVDVSLLGVPGGFGLDLMLSIVERVSFIDVKNDPMPAPPNP